VTQPRFTVLDDTQRHPGPARQGARFAAVRQPRASLRAYDADEFASFTAGGPR